MKTFTIEQDRSDIDILSANLVHEVAELKRLMGERIKLADSDDTLWIDADDVFAELEAANANPVSCIEQT